MLKTRMQVEREWRYGFTQIRLAVLTDLPQSHISGIEIGQRQPTPDQLQRIARVLNVDPPEALLTMIDDATVSIEKAS
jgi:transcriptional regulator with XRE-family HTH domain